MDNSLPTVVGRGMVMTIADHERAALVCIQTEMAKPNSDNALIMALAEAVRMGREYVDFVSARTLGPKHQGMKVSASGLLGRIRDGMKLERSDRFMLGELLRHMEEMGKRYYAGDVKVCDEFLQLYCCDKERSED